MSRIPNVLQIQGLCFLMFLSTYSSCGFFRNAYKPKTVNKLMKIAIIKHLDIEEFVTLILNFIFISLHQFGII